MHKLFKLDDIIDTYRYVRNGIYSQDCITFPALSVVFSEINFDLGRNFELHFLSITSFHKQKKQNSFFESNVLYLVTIFREAKHSTGS